VRLSGPKTDLEMQGLREVTGKHVYIDKKGQLIQRLPDTRIVPENVAKCYDGGKGRDREIQKKIDKLTSMEWEQCYRIRLFYPSEKKARNAYKEHRRLPPRLQPREIFLREYFGKSVSRWVPKVLSEHDSLHKNQ
jgi:hypothetical protein